jgi:hydrogenase expression/formation protein HypC
MCLAIPGEVARIDGDRGEINFSGAYRQVNLSLVAGVKVGDYVLVHAGCAIQIVPPEEARETLKLFEEIFES